MLDVVDSMNSFLSLALIFLLCGTGIYFTFRLKFIQVRKFGASWNSVFGNLKFKGEAAGDDGMSSFQSLATAIAAQVGTGNIAGCATAIVMGGPGAIFWMWVSAFFGMATIYAEATAAQKYKTTIDGKVVGGPVYYIKAAFNNTFGKALAAIFAILIIFALGFMGNMVQSNSISAAFATAFNTPPLLVGIAVAVCAFFIFIGGVQRIASVVEKVVPIMAAFYIIISLYIIISKIDQLPGVIQMIFVGAFNPTAIAGGVVGITVRKAMQYGVARGLFSNEAGMGSTPHAHAIAKVKYPCDQGLVAMMGVFIDTFIVLNMTAFTILITGVYTGDGTTGIALAQNAFANVYGSVGGILIAICLFFFAFSTIIGWYFFGETNIIYLFGKKAVPVYAILVCGFVVLGSVLKVDFVWSLADLFNSLMVIPNLIGLLGISAIVIKTSKDWEKIKASEK